MKTRRAAFAALALALALLAALTALPAGWAEDAGLDFWNLPPAWGELDEAVREGREWDRKRGEVLQLLALREAATVGVVEGRLTLDEAAADFLALNRSSPLMLARTRDVFPAASDEASARLQVLSHVAAIQQYRDGIRQIERVRAVKSRPSWYGDRPSSPAGSRPRM